MNNLYEAILSKKSIKVGDKIIFIEPKLTKKEFLDSLNDLGKKSEQEYFEYFDLTPISLQMYPTVKYIKEKYGISYKELSNIGRIDLSKIVGHSITKEILKCRSKKMNLLIPIFDTILNMNIDELESIHESIKNMS